VHKCSLAVRGGMVVRATWLGNAGRFARGGLAVSLWISALAFTTEAPARAAPGSPTGAAAGQLWSRLLAHCGESYFYAGSVFDHSGMLSDVGAGNNPSVIEFRGVKFNPVPIRVTDAERLNGISARARVTMFAHVYRVDGGDWEDGPDLRPRNINDVSGLALQNIVSDAGEMGAGGSMAFELIQFKGKWMAARSGSAQSGVLLSSAGFYSLDQLQGDAAPKYTCPQLSAKVQTTLNEAAAAATAAQHDAALEQAWSASSPNHDPKRGIPYLLISSDEAAILQMYSHRGSPFPTHAQVAAHMTATQAIAARFPILPTTADWLPVGTSLSASQDIDAVDPMNGGTRRLIVVTITSGSHAGKLALIDAGNYGASFNDPGRVWRDDAQRKQFETDARDGDSVLVRDRARGVPYVHVTEDELAALAAAKQSTNLFPAEQLERRLGWRFTNEPPNDRWLAPGTTFSPILFGRTSGPPVTWWYSQYSGKGLALVRVESGPHSGEAALIDMRNYTTDHHTICPEPAACVTRDD
jgi:hypothetical protein